MEITRTKLTAEEISAMRDSEFPYMCRDCERGVYEMPNSATGFQHRPHLPGEPAWRCPRTPLPPFGVLRREG